jgi:hypothetical protein
VCIGSPRPGQVKSDSLGVTPNACGRRARPEDTAGRTRLG